MPRNTRTLVALILATSGLACLQTLRCEAFQGAYSLSGTKWTSSPSSHTASALSRLFPPSHPYTTTRQSSSSSSPTVLHMSSTAKKAPGTAKLDTPWEELGFEFRPTNSHVRLQYKDGEWMKPELVKVCTECTDCRPFETDAERCPRPGIYSVFPFGGFKENFASQHYASPTHQTFLLSVFCCVVDLWCRSTKNRAIWL